MIADKRVTRPCERRSPWFGESAVVAMELELWTWDYVNDRRSPTYGNLTKEYVFDLRNQSIRADSAP